MLNQLCSNLAIKSEQSKKDNTMKRALKNQVYNISEFNKMQNYPSVKTSDERLVEQIMNIKLQDNSSKENIQNPIKKSSHISILNQIKTKPNSLESSKTPVQYFNQQQINVNSN